ncbi:uncharacterized protein LOC105722702 isoform X1 [Aotus nancymaae]|uniref:uncharacterized protein LOC105722702 isoform X1 n=1 Tax=Aotus nancymaae TaxID=37293 RepID=UPI0030FE3903
MLVGGSGRSSCCGRPSACWQGRWSILPSNEGSTESWFWCGLAFTVHPMLVDNSIWSGCHDRSIACWQGRWWILLTNRGCVEFLMRHGLNLQCTPCWQLAQDGAVAVGGTVPVVKKMVNSSKQRRPRGALVSVRLGIHSAPGDDGWLRMHTHFICTSLVALAWKEVPCSRRMVFILCDLWRCHEAPGYTWCGLLQSLLDFS